MAEGRVLAEKACPPILMAEGRVLAEKACPPILMEEGMEFGPTTACVDLTGRRWRPEL
jgi:hypothetical protein